MSNIDFNAPHQVLFIGGGCDGRRHTFPKLSATVSSHVLRSHPFPPPDAPLRNIEVENHHLRVWEAEGKSYPIYILAGMTNREAFERLLQHYQPNPHPAPCP